MNRSRSIDMRVGAYVKAVRILRNFTQEQLASKLGMNSEYIQEYESGMTQMTEQHLYAFARALDVDIEFFFKRLESSVETDCNVKEMV